MGKESAAVEEVKAEAPVKTEAPAEPTPAEKFEKMYGIDPPEDDAVAAIAKIKEKREAKEQAKEQAKADAKKEKEDSGAEKAESATEEPAEEKIPAAPAKEEVDEEDEDEGGEVVPDELWDAAKDLGLDDEEIQSFKSVDDLERAVRLQQRTIARIREQQPSTTETKTVAEEPAKKPAQDEEELPDLEPDEYDEKLAKSFNTMKKRLRTLEERNKQLEQFEFRQREREHAETRARMESMFEEVTEEYGEISDGKKREIAVEMDYLLQQGRKYKSEKDLFKAAAARVFVDQAVKSERRRLGKQLQERSKQATARPQGGRKLATSKTKEKIRELQDKGKLESDESGSTESFL